MTKKEKKQDDLGIETYTEREGLLLQIKDNVDARIKQGKINTEIDEVVKGYIDREISKEKEKRLKTQND